MVRFRVSLRLGLVRFGSPPSSRRNSRITDPQTCTIFIPAWAQIWGLLGFLVIKIIAVHLVCTYPLRSECEDRTCLKRCMMHEDCPHIFFFVCFVCVIGRKSRRPLNYDSPMGCTWGWYRRSGISGVYLW